MLEVRVSKENLWWCWLCVCAKCVTAQCRQPNPKKHLATLGLQLTTHLDLKLLSRSPIQVGQTRFLNLLSFQVFQVGVTSFQLTKENFWVRKRQNPKTLKCQPLTQQQIRIKNGVKRIDDDGLLYYVKNWRKWIPSQWQYMADDAIARGLFMQ